MRTACITTLIQLAERDKRIFLLTGDLGFTVLEPFREKFPNRFINMGVAEQNMMGVACGLALSGKVVFVYSIIPFVTLRCLEQIRNDVCYHNANVNIIGVGGGFSYSQQGTTHHALEDIALMSAMPNMTVVCPGDPLEVAWCLKAAAETASPFYVRLGKSGEPIIHREPLAFTIGKGITIAQGNNLTLIATGPVIDHCIRARNLLLQKGLEARVISMHTVKPIDQTIIHTAAKETGTIFSVEEHYATGGLGSAIARVLAISDLPYVRFRQICVAEEFVRESGSQQYFRGKHGLTPEDIVKIVVEVLM